LSEVLLRLLLRLPQGLLLPVALVDSILDLVKQAGRSRSLLARLEGGCSLLLWSELLLGELLLRSLGSKLLVVELLLLPLGDKLLLLSIKLLLLLIIEPLLLWEVGPLLLLLRVELLLLRVHPLQLLLLCVEPLLLLLRQSVALLRQAVALLRQAVAPLLLDLPPFTHWPNIDVTSKARHTLPGPAVCDHLGYSSVTDLVLVENCLRSPIPSSSLGSWTPVTSILGVPQISLTRGVGSPGAVRSTQRVNIFSSHTVEPASPIEETCPTISWNSRTETRYLFLYPWVMFYTPWDVCPSTIILTQWDVVPAELTHNIAQLARK